MSLCYIVSMALSFFGMRFIEESISDTIENTSGAIISILSVAILGKVISGTSVVAIIVIVIGVLGIGFLEGHGDTDRRKNLQNCSISSLCWLFSEC